MELTLPHVGRAFLIAMCAEQKGGKVLVMPLGYHHITMDGYSEHRYNRIWMGGMTNACDISRQMHIPTLVDFDCKRGS